MKELLEIPLGGAPYGYTPFCDSRPEMDGFRYDICVCTYIHTYIHAYIHTHTCLDTYLHTYIHRYIDT